MDVSELEKLKSPVAKEAAEFINTVVNSPYYDGYLAVLTTINNLNQELQDGVVKIVPEMIATEDGMVSDKNDKSFDRAHKYITDMKIYYDQLTFFRGLLTPKQVEEAKEATSLLDEARLQLKKTNGAKV